MTDYEFAAEPTENYPYFDYHQANPKYISNLGLNDEDIDPVVDAIMSDVEAYFQDSTDHRPSQDMLEALGDIPRTVLSIIKGEAEPKFYLSPLDTGVGKTTVLAHTIRRIRNDQASAGKPELGVVLCLGRLTQITSMIQSMRLREDEYSVLAANGAPVEDDDGNRTVLSELGLGQDRIKNAPILLTTHAMIETRLVGRSWEEAKEFYYKGKPRQLRVWDESIFTRKGITLDKQALYRVAGSLREFTKEIEDFLDKLAVAKDGDILVVPDLASKGNLQTIRADLPQGTRHHLNDTLQDLWYLSGKPARVRKDGRERVLIQYRTSLPDDIKPMLVLDASARVRGTYKQQARTDGDIVRLREAKKQYHHISINFENGPSGKSNFGESYWRRLEEVSDIIKRHPDRKPLVLHHMKDRWKGIGDVEADLKFLLMKPDGLRANAQIPKIDVTFCHWGVHNATNAFADRDLVITATILHHPSATYEARGRAASDRLVQQKYENEEFQEIRHGEILHDLLQGLSRGSLRNLKGDEAKECLIYLRASRASGVKGALPTLFPGCRILNGWKPRAKPINAPGSLTLMQCKVLKFVSAAFRDGPIELEFPDIYGPLGILSNNFPRIIYAEPFQTELQKMGLHVRSGRPKAIIPAI